MRNAECSLPYRVEPTKSRLHSPPKAKQFLIAVPLAEVNSCVVFCSASHILRSHNLVSGYRGYSLSLHAETISSLFSHSSSSAYLIAKNIVVR